MAEKEYIWLKLHINFFTDPKKRMIIQQKEGHKFMIVYQKLLLLGIQADPPGVLRFSKSKPYNAVRLSVVIDEDQSLIEAAMRFLCEEVELIKIDLEDNIYIEEAVKLIGKKSTSTARVRKFRERQKRLRLQGPESETLHETFHNVTENKEEMPTFEEINETFQVVSSKSETFRPFQCNAIVEEEKEEEKEEEEEREREEREKNETFHNADRLPPLSPKILHLDYVYLTKSEYDGIQDIYGKTLTNSYITKLNHWIGKDPKKTDERKALSHYHYLLDWMDRDGCEKKIVEKKKTCPTCGKKHTYYKDVCKTCFKKEIEKDREESLLEEMDLSSFIKGMK